MRLITPIVGSPSRMLVSCRSSWYRVAPMTSAAFPDSLARVSAAAPPRAPRLRVRIATSWPSRRCMASVPAAPISTSSGCAPMASTLCRAASRAARPLATSAVTVSTSLSGRTGFSRNSSALFRSARTA